MTRGNDLNAIFDEEEFTGMNIVWVGAILDGIFRVGIFPVGVFLRPYLNKWKWNYQSYQIIKFRDTFLNNTALFSSILFIVIKYFKDYLNDIFPFPESKYAALAFVYLFSIWPMIRLDFE